MKSLRKNVFSEYLKTINNTDWITEEAYKFEFANFIFHNVGWDASNKQILDIFLKSQNIKYSAGGRGIQFIKKSGRKTLGEFIHEDDVELFRKFRGGVDLTDLDLEQRTMSYPGLSAWIASLFPAKFYPVPQTGFHQTMGYLFQIDKEDFPKRGLNYIKECQSFMALTESELSQYPIEELFLPVLNQFYAENSELGIEPKQRFEKVDWVWAVQDFHLFVYREVLGLYENRVSEDDVKDEVIDERIEGNSLLAIHKRYERNSSLIKKIKQQRLKDDPLLQCDVCGFSFIETYGDAGKGFIEAHHINPLSERDGAKVTKADEIALLCSNCHRMAHKGDPVYDIDVLKEMINNS